MTTVAAQKTSFKLVPIYENEATIVRFEADGNTPGFTHRVIVIDKKTRTMVGRRWLSSGFKPNAKTAAFFAAEFGL